MKTRILLIVMLAIGSLSVNAQAIVKHNIVCTSLFNYNGTLFFSGDDGIHGAELWKSDGTDSGTVMVKDINPGPNGSAIIDFCVFNGNLFFLACGRNFGRQIWKTDGTEAGTMMAIDIFNPSSLTAVNGKLFFVEDFQLYVSSGTTSSTINLTQFFNNGGDAPAELTNVNGTLFFRGSDWQLWKSDGTVLGTKMVKKIVGSAWPYPQNLFDFNGTLFFNADTAFRRSFLWKSDGTDTGTVIIKELVPSHFTKIHNSLFFFNNNNLWKTEGTAAGTIRINDSTSYSLTDVNGTLFFMLWNTNRYQLWKSDGTSGGAVLVKDIGPIHLTNFNGNLAFVGNSKLWISDGTNYGTNVIDSSAYYIDNLTVVNQNLFYTAYDKNMKLSLWKYPPNYTVDIPPVVSFFPNPFNSYVTITIKGTIYNTYLYIYNLLGQEVSSIPVGCNKQITIPRGNLPAGMYFYKLIEDNKEVIGVGKMVIED